MRFLVVGSGRFALRLAALPAHGRPCAAAILGHAMMASGGYLARSLGAACAAAGLSTFVLDFRGHGGSRPRAGPGASWNFDDLVRGDLAAAVDAVRQLEPDLPLVYAGHSLGGIVGLVHQATAPPAHRFARLAAICSNVWDLRSEPPARALSRWCEASALWLSTLPANRTLLVRATRFGTDEESGPYLRQLTRWYRTGTFASADRSVDYRAALGRVGGPVRLAWAGGDRWCDAADVARLASFLPEGAAELVEEGRASGLPFDPDHFGLFRDRRGSPALARVAAWLASAG